MHPFRSESYEWFYYLSPFMLHFIPNMGLIYTEVAQFKTDSFYFCLSSSQFIERGNRQNNNNRDYD